LIAIAAAAHQGWSANIFTTASDMFPKQAIGSIVGIGGMMGAVGGMIFQSSTGYILQHNNSNYIPVFVVCGSVYLVALLIMHLLLPGMEPAKID
jgi:ACS family hexuronate transporter-like MFS transporter